jgi:hypothetical protein
MQVLYLAWHYYVYNWSRHFIYEEIMADRFSFNNLKRHKDIDRATKLYSKLLESQSKENYSSKIQLEYLRRNMSESSKTTDDRVIRLGIFPLYDWQAFKLTWRDWVFRILTISVIVFVGLNFKTPDFFEIGIMSVVFLIIPAIMYLSEIMEYARGQNTGKRFFEEKQAENADLNTMEGI